MNSLLLFRMYMRFEETKAYAEHRRRQEPPNFAHFGLAVDCDKNAHNWQKWNRLAIMTQTELERRLGSQSLTGQDLVTAFSSLFDELEPETPEEVDITLQEFGYDPDEIGARIKDAAERALEELKFNASASAGFRY